ncbi:DUF2846 domain-containing protein [Vibrio vulnificus]|nr:DUF2846 domain-containing protein [Vibrio vulnificus]
MKNKIILCSAVLAVLSGCASVPMVDSELSDQAKQFEAPTEGKAGVYVYRPESGIGGALKKDVHIDGECIGETAPGVFFYHEVDGDKEHIVSTESEFSPNEVTLFTEQGRLYFVQQYIKMGAFVGGADLVVVDESTGKSDVYKTKMAIKGNCSAK